MSNPSFPRSFLPALVIGLAPVSLVVGILWGSVDITPARLMQALFHPGADPLGEILWQLRLPRVLTAFACGGLLSLSGVLLQVLLRNPLADPYILGISGGAAAAALTGMLLGLSWALVNGFALGGALAAMGAVFALTYRSRDWNIHRLLLTGVVLAAGFGAVISLLLTLAPDAQVHGMLFWLMGDVSHSTRPGWAWAILAAAGLFAWSRASSLDVLELGEVKARSLGVPVTGLQVGVYFAAGAATAAAVMEAGSIGFVGLVVPHMVRLAGASSHRLLLPLSILLGGSLLTLADTLARTVAAPVELPVGVLTALLGVPVLLVLLRKGQ